MQAPAAACLARRRPCPAAGAQDGAPKLLHRPATPGLRGALLDYLTVAAGTSQLIAALATGLLLRSPAAVAAQQATHLLLTASPRAYCRRAVGVQGRRLAAPGQLAVGS